MSGGTICKCPESQKPIAERRWRVTARYCNYSAFSGYHWTPSNYSEVRCSECRTRWRTKARYVSQLKDAVWDDKRGDWVET